MSLKNRDNHNRWRNKTVAFRVSPEEDRQIETFVKLSGLTKQDYITRRLTCRDVVVQGNPRVYKALRDQLAAVLDELRRIEAGGADLWAKHFQNSTLGRFISLRPTRILRKISVKRRTSAENCITENSNANTISTSVRSLRKKKNASENQNRRDARERIAR